MTNTYKLAKTWQWLLIAPSVSLILLFLLLPFIDTGSDGISGYILPFLIVGGISGSMIYMALTSKLLTSPEGIESVSFGIRIKVTWDQVEKIDINPYGIVNLVFKESIFKSRVVTALLHPLAYDRTIQLSPYIEDLATSNLLRDIEKYVAKSNVPEPNSNIPEFVNKQKRSLKTYQKAGVIGLYYFVFFIAYAFFAIILQRRVEDFFTALGWSDVALFAKIASGSLIYGIFINAMNLLGYNAAIENANENEISHKARAHYLSPVAILLLGSLVTIVSSNIDVEVPVFVILLTGILSPRVSTFMERLLFQDNVLDGQESA